MRGKGQKHGERKACGEAGAARGRGLQIRVWILLAAVWSSYSNVTWRSWARKCRLPCAPAPVKGKCQSILFSSIALSLSLAHCVLLLLRMRSPFLYLLVLFLPCSIFFLLIFLFLFLLFPFSFLRFLLCLVFFLVLLLSSPLYLAPPAVLCLLQTPSLEISDTKKACSPSSSRIISRQARFLAIQSLAAFAL